MKSNCKVLIVKSNKEGTVFSPDSPRRIGESGLSGHRLGVKRCRCDGMQALADRRLYCMYVGGRKAKQNAQMRFFEQADARNRENQKAQQFIHKSKTVKAFDKTFKD
ncbi:MAG: hypothetical protein A4E63_00645 [Syntrophorhabdus sp. PtaU1.Bin050]|nr:MAG: hypothetical protein A4E63_00645 [Syntrophorhabdus sp. PtaU1.Bin050]